MANHISEMIQVNGAPIQMLRGGSGPPLLYLHSAAGEGWMPFHDLLARDFQVLAPAHPGFLMSEGLERIDNMEDLVFHYLDLLDLLQIDRVDVVGLSLGGWLAAELATRNPERVRRLVLTDAVGLFLPGVPDDFEFFRDPVTAPGYTEEIRRRTFHDPAAPVALSFIPDVPSLDQIMFALKARQATARLAWNPYFHNPKLRGRLHRVKAPTLVIWGDSDGLVPLDFGRAYQEGIPGSKLLVLEKCGHVPPIEKPNEWASAVKQFLS